MVLGSYNIPLKCHCDDALLVGAHHILNEVLGNSLNINKLTAIKLFNKFGIFS